MSAQRYWYLANDPRRTVTARSAEEKARKDWILDLPEDIRRRVIEYRVLSEPNWPEIHSYVPEGKTDREGRVPMLFTTKEGAASELRDTKEASEPPSTFEPSRGLGKKRRAKLLIASFLMRWLGSTRTCLPASWRMPSLSM